MNADAQHRPWSLAAWLALALAGAALALALAAALWLVVERPARDRVESQVGDHLAELAGQSATHLEHALAERHRELQLLARRLAGRADWPAVQAELDAVHESFDFYGWVGLADARGIVRAASGGRLVGTNVASLAWFQRALQGEPFAPVQEAAFLGGAAAAAGEAPRHFQLAFQVRLADGGTGVLAASVSWNWASAWRAGLLRTLAAGRQVEPLLVAPDGAVLLGPSGMEGRQLQTGSLRRALADESGSLREAWDGTDFFVGYARVRGHPGASGPGWVVLVREQAAQALAPLAALRRTLAATALVLAVLAGVAGWALAQAIARPLWQVERAVRVADEGEAGIARPQRAYREAVSLAGAVDVLARRQAARQAQLRERIAGLEQSLEQRTEELRLAREEDVSRRDEIERLKSEFVSTVSHELRTPLTSVYGSLDMLASGMAGPLPNDVAHLLKISRQSAERLVRLVDDMVDVERIASGTMEYAMEPVPLLPLIEHGLHATREAAQARGLRMRIAGDGPDLVVMADADRIAQVCARLLSNAVKFSPQGGLIEVTVARTGDRARVGIVDHGSGVPPTFHERIFGRFAQADASDSRSQGGTGLGLNICRSIVLAHGGMMGYESEPGVRTEFWFELPLAQAAADPAPAVSQPAA